MYMYMYLFVSVSMSVSVSYVHTYMHAYVHTYIHTYTYMHTCILACIPIYVYTYMHIVRFYPRFTDALLTLLTHTHRLNACYKNQESLAFQDALGEAVLRLCRVIPHGVLCFLPSYALLDKLLRRA